MEEWVLSLGYIGLFLVSFLSATILPLTSAVFVVALPPLGYSPWGVLAVATAGNYLGTLTNYAIGRTGGDFFLARWVKIEQEKLAKAEHLFGRYGAPLLFFSWLPIIGDLLAVAAGVLRVQFGRFTLWTLSGKAARYAVVLGFLAIATEYIPWLDSLPALV